MANVLLMGRQYANHLQRLLAANVTVSDEDATFTHANLVGTSAAKPYFPFRHASPPVADRAVTIDLNVLLGLNGGAEVGDLSNITTNNVGSGNVITNVSTPVNSGSRAFQLTIATPGPGNQAYGYWMVPALAGERATVEVALRGDGTRVARFRVFNEQTRKYLKPDGTWTATVTDLFTRSAATYATSTLAFSVEGYSVAVPLGVYTLQLIMLSDGNNPASAGSVFVDDVCYRPSTDTFVLIGHNLDPSIAPELRRDSAGFSGAGTLEASPSIYQPTMYVLTAAMRDERYWRFKATGTNSTRIQYGSLWLGQKFAVSQKPVYSPGSLTEEWFMQQIRVGDPGAEAAIFNLEDTPRRKKTVPFEYVTAAAYIEGRDRAFRSSAFGQYPVLYIDDDTDPEAAMYCRLPGNWANQLQMPNVRAASGITLTEMAFPIAAS